MQHPNLDAFQVIADGSRREILHMLTEGSMSINAIAGKFEISRPAISKHIKILEHAGFLTIEDSGRERFCMLSQQGFTELRDWLEYYDNFWKQKLTKLESLMDAGHKEGDL
ncbi:MULTISPECIES: ArsR/SmtB family transcription factor [Pedobacter]|uniref:Regulatory protein ArsR n=1 Tax=Pedobacter heparinus (strain ATCC 13125 / DSM 2366 / CIP 104194 / JCM 7457 / NBRC 12017 / NCIMB 9290 / NRRL B-14731 / HIM 762-3) TaxID=485917 RepID=C6XUS9_PEDHD|nr:MULTISPECIES: metalloregulator ArsR/SmtB family transcription factor [Pedobacter]ACU03929.1 regulatory protein ArsR [Pedobacter heparinus DSM 2366]MBB5436545.1 DNA-binding transcriptional ArsR family regulator [Pedobacter sp. AK017]